MGAVRNNALWLAASWAVAGFVLSEAWEGFSMLYLEPQAILREMLGISLQRGSLSAQYSFYAYDASGGDLWTYEVPATLASQLRIRCNGSQVIQFYDPRHSFSNNVPLKGCIVAVRAIPSKRRDENIVLAGNRLQIYRSTY
jgi:hypothetical protein